MKLFYKLIIFALILAFAGPFFLHVNGKPIMTISDLIPNLNFSDFNFGQSDTAGTMDDGNYGVMSSGNVDTFYRWKNEQGVWQYTQTPPPEHVTTTVVTVDPQANMIRAMDQEKIDGLLGIKSSKPKAPVTLGPPAAGETPNIPFPSTIPLQKVPELIDSAKQIQELSQQRTEAMDNLLKQQFK